MKSAAAKTSPTSDSPVNTPVTGLVRVDGRPADVVAFEEALVGFFVEAADLLGAPKSVAAIYAICFASPEPLGFSEINARLEISSGSISQGLRFLREIGALKIVPDEKQAAGQPDAVKENDTPAPRKSDVSSSEFQRLSVSRDGRGTRTPRYTPDLALRNLVLRFIDQRLETQLQSGRNRLDVIAATIPPSLRTNAEALEERLAALRTWHDRAGAVLPLVKTFLKLT